MKPFFVNKKFCLALLMGMLIFSLPGYSKATVKDQQQPTGYPIASDVQTTTQRTIVPEPTPTNAINLW